MFEMGDGHEGSGVWVSDLFKKKGVAQRTEILMTIKSKPKVINMKGPSRSFKIGFKIKLKTLNINPTIPSSCHPPVIKTPSM